MVIEHLKADQYGELAGVADGFVPDPKSSVALVARNDHEIVGRVFLLTPAHLEGPWVRPDLRGTTMGKRLIDAAEEVAKRCGVRKMFAYGASEDLENYLMRLGYKREPFTVWTKEI